MAFWNKVSRTVTEKSQEAINYGKNVADTVKLNSMISDEEKKVESLYYQIGKKYVNHFYGNYDEVFRDELLQMKNSMELIKKYKDQINELKGTQICEKCGAEVSKGSIFCSVCGNKMPELKVNTPVGNERICPGCGAVIREGDLFCMGCGRKVEEAVIQPVEPVYEEPASEIAKPSDNDNIEELKNMYLGESADLEQKPEPEEEKDLSQFCKNCGAALEEGDAFCSNCGYPVK